MINNSIDISTVTNTLYAHNDTSLIMQTLQCRNWCMDQHFAHDYEYVQLLLAALIPFIIYSILDYVKIDENKKAKFINALYTMQTFLIIAFLIINFYKYV